MLHPEISVIIPVYNGERFLAETLQSVQRQTFENWECVVVDDGSTDSSPDIIREFVRQDPRFRYIRQDNAGVSVARNRGLAEANASSPFVVFTDQDDVWLRDALEVLSDALRSAREDVVGVHGLPELIGGNGQPLDDGYYTSVMRQRVGFVEGRGIVEWPPHAPTTLANAVWAIPACPPGSMLLRRLAAAAAGPWDSRYLAAQDWVYIINLTRLGNLAFIDRVVIRYRKHGRNASCDHLRNTEEIRRVYVETFRDSRNTPAQQAMLRKGWRAWQVYKTKEHARRLPELVRRRDWREAATAIARLPVYVVRYIRGYPTLSGF